MHNAQDPPRSARPNPPRGLRNGVRWVAGILVGFFLTVPAHLIAQQKEQTPERLLPIVDGGKWGYINLAVETVIAPRFEQAWEFSEGLARVSVDERIGFIDTTGRLVIEPQYEEAWDFSHARALVRLKGGQIAVIDKEGRIVFRIDDDCEREPCVGNVGRSGIPVPFLQNSAGLYGYYDGLLMVMVGNTIGYVDPDGNFAIEPQFWGGSVFSHGFAQVAYQSRHGRGPGRGGLIDRSGQMVIPDDAFGPRAAFGFVGMFSDGLAIAGRPWKTGYVDKTGEFVIAPRFKYSCPFSDGLAKVVTKKTLLLGEPKKWGYVNKRGEMVFEVLAKNAPFPYGTCHDGWFSEGLAVVRPNGGPKSGYINKDFEFAIPPVFDRARAFRDGVAFVEKNNVIGYIDKTGKFIWRSDVGRPDGRAAPIRLE